jgi:MFS family permease
VGPSATTPNAGRATAAIFLFAFLGWTFDFYDLVLLGFLKEDVARDLHLSRAAESWLLGAGLGASGIGGLVAGALADKLGKRTVLSVTVLIYSLGSLICGLAPNGAVFFAGRLTQGIGIGGEWAIGHGMLAEAVAPRMRGRAAAALQAGEPFGVAIAALVGYLILPRAGWRAVLVGSSVTALLAVAARASVHLPDRPSVTAARPYLAELRAAARVPGLRRRFVAAWLLGVFKLGTYWSCYTWLPTFLSRGMHQTVGRSLAWMVTAQLGQLAGMLSFGAISDRLGRRPAFALYSLLTAAAVGALAIGWSALLPQPGAVLDGDARARDRFGVHRGVRRAPGRALPGRGAGRRHGRDLQPGARGSAADAAPGGGDGDPPRARRRPGRPVRAGPLHRGLGLGAAGDARDRAPQAQGAISRWMKKGSAPRRTHG